MDAKARTAKPEPKTKAEKEQSARFKETARKLGCDTTPGALDRAFEKITTARVGAQQKPSTR